MMPAGDLRYKLEIQKPVEAVDSSGGPYKEYIKDFECWGSIMANNGQKVFRSARFDVQVDGLVEIRFRNDITADHRVKVLDEDRILKLKGVYDPTGLKERLYLVYAEVS